MPLDEAAERYYALLPDDPPEDGEDGDGQGGDDPGKCGGVKPAGDKAQQAQAAAEMDVAVMQAAEACKGRGDLPGGLDRLIKAIQKPKVDPWHVLREYVSTTARNDYSWAPPNRRYVHMGLYLPSLHSEELGDVLLAIDTSGSITPNFLQTFANHAQAIFEAYSCRLTILYHDTSVARVEHWEPSDGDLKLRPAGGGGTNHTCVFDYCKEHGLCPTVMVALSDMDSCYPSLPPEFPVIWARIGGGGTIPPWGRLVDVEA
jgi:predicted metal-dependent peptidase